MNAIVRLADPKPEDIFFGQEPLVTDWDGVRKDIVAKHYGAVDVMSKIIAMEPFTETDFREHEHWTDQQRLRLALLHEAGKPLESEHTCEVCGVRKADPLDRHDSHTCLHCRSRVRQLYNGGGRGSCEYVRPAYNPKSKHWGHLYYWSWSNNTFLFWLTDFFPTRESAENALLPVRLYFDWLERKYDGMLSYRRFANLLDVAEAMKLPLPLDPAHFEAVLREKITADMKEDHDVLAYYVREGMRKHKDTERDRG